MDKQEPKIIVGDMGNAELLRWMMTKIDAARGLSNAIDHKAWLQNELVAVDDRIEKLTDLAALELLSTNQECQCQCQCQCHSLTSSQNG